MNIDGLSEATLEKFIARGFIKNFGDIFEIGKHKDEIIRMEGFWRKSYENLIESLKRAKKDRTSKGAICTGYSQYRSCQCKDDLQRTEL